MESKPLFLEIGECLKQRLCGKCGRVWDDEKSAELCCKCAYCGLYSDWKPIPTNHPECRRKEMEAGEARTMAKAVLINDYAGPFLIDGDVYEDVAELFNSVNPADVPEYGFCARYQPPTLEIEDLMSEISSEMHDEWDPSGGAELAVAIGAWNEANKDNGTYFEDCSRKWSKETLKTLPCL